MNKDIEIMAKTIYGEARGDYHRKDGGLTALIAVGNVIMNRSLASGESITEVCLKPKQFSCWNVNDPNRKIIENVKDNDKIYQICFVTASKIIFDEISDITGGANHYYSKYMKKPPYWAVGETPVAVIGSHIFLKL
ncbi:MAG: cell wall hydrolase [Holosporales bacterium]|jgi:spore germination cell wall hydrolase CwlJ-like protein|nr:cell wall hydrolase [Holosporales bacterium]